MLWQYEKVHPIDPQDVMDKMEQESKQFIDIAEYEGNKKSLKQLKSVECHKKELKTIGIKGLKKNIDERKFHIRTTITKADDLQPETNDRFGLLIVLTALFYLFLPYSELVWIGLFDSIY